MLEENYPCIETMCRLCLKENSAEVNIFNTANPKEAVLSIPIRIMSCVALEVQENDNLPKSICSECRYQLEKCFYFRKRSQYADTKLRKHLRLISLGKKSKVFAKKSDSEDDEEDDEAEFADSLNFIHEQDQVRDDQLKLEQHQEIIKLRPMLIDEIRREFNIELEETILPEVRKEVEGDIRKKVRSEIQQEIKEELRCELEEEIRQNLLPVLREQCREEELTGILNEMENFLREKRTQQDNEQLKRERGKILISLSELRENPSNKPKPELKRRASKSHENLAKQLRTQIAKPNSLKPEETTRVVAKATVQIESSNAESCSGGEENENDNDSSNYYIIDDHMDEEETNDAHDDEHDEEQDHGNDDECEEGAAQDEEQDTLGNLKTTAHYQMEAKPKRSVTSYQIDGSGEDIQLFKRKDSLKSDGGKDDANIVILNFERSSVEEEHLEMVEFVKFNDKVIRVKNDINVGIPNDTQKSRSSSTEMKEMKTEDVDNSTAVVSQRVTDTPKTFKCPSCPLQFSTENSYNRHIRTHVKAGEKGVSFHCPECGIFVSCKSALTRHMIIHSGVKPHVCEECGKSFVQREILKRHMQTHTGAKPYKCKHCGRAFAQKANLIQHVNKNHLEVPIVGQHPCPLCPKRFNHSSGLSRHLATHSGVTFQCTECERTFSDRSSVKRHIVNMHGSSLESDSAKD